MGDRCEWCGTDPVYVDYHDTEWGVPEWDGRALWEKLVLDGFQAGLSWITILKKRDNFRAAFEDFNPEVIAGWGEEDITRLLGDAGIVRSRAKIVATIGNAQAYLRIEEREGFSPFLWKFVNGSPLQNRPEGRHQVPTESPESQAMSKALKAEGFKFCGPVITYAFMQATGLINDHYVTCPARRRVEALAKAPSPV